MSLFGEANRWGRLPYTLYPASWAPTHSMLDHNIAHSHATHRYGANRIAIRPFGFGLSLTRFSLDVELADSPVTSYTLSTDASDTLNISVTATNVGNITGDVVVIAYAIPTNVPTLALRPVQSLFDFTRLYSVVPGGKATASFVVSARSLNLVTPDGDVVGEPGRYTISLQDGSYETRNVAVELVGPRHVFDKFPTV
mmetsp:Transcript_75724/g.177717  ORF Transcript_75724/g.177717 Transcript_75724/m.177717 type:complete len:197 (-) Transcript_75724:74-664(-)